MEALKPLLLNHGATLTISDEVKEVNGWGYIEATCIIEVYDTDIDEVTNFTCKSQAGIEKAGGMALPQAFGSASSYARKYALNAMFLIDDTKDADATNQHAKTPVKASSASKNASSLPALKKLCKDAKLDFLDVAKWALTVSNKDINISANASELVTKWDKCVPVFNKWLKEGK